MASLERRISMLEQRGADKHMTSMVVIFGDSPFPKDLAEKDVLRVVFVKPKECADVESR